jgi:predicted unusual protein kinase regulating ubiquinone biosynthesis (AarF/ABC1/UbiB family)
MIRKLITSDIYKVSKVLKKMGLKVDTKDKTQEQLGAEFIISAFENLHLAELEVNEFFGSLSGMTAQEFAELPIEKTFELIAEFKNISGIDAFFNFASQLTN